MIIEELEKKLIKQINSLEDELQLDEIYRLLGFVKDESDIYYFTKEQKRKIEEAQERYKIGEFLTAEEANKEVDEWLDKFSAY